MKKLLLVIVTLIVLTCAGYFIWKYLGNNKKSTITSSENQAKNTELTEAQAVQQVKNSATLNFGQSTSVATTSLPQDLSFLLIDGATNTKIWSVNYSSGKTGYSVELDAQYKLQQAYNNFRSHVYTQNSEWKLLHGQFSNTFGILEIESPKYQVSININSVLAEQVHATIQVQNK